ncbi:unnamed protein product, partial [Sphacelaria rigidula]
MIYLQECWAAVSDDAKALIVALLTVDSNERLTAEQALRHPWLQ